MIHITTNITLDEAEIEIVFIRSPGPGGQNVNKVSTGVQLRFNINRSKSLTEIARARLLDTLGSRLTLQGEIIIKATRHRSQERNKEDALQRLRELIRNAVTPPKARHKTKPTFASKQRRLTKKKQNATTKILRRHVKKNDE